MVRSMVTIVACKWRRSAVLDWLDTIDKLETTGLCVFIGSAQWDAVIWVLKDPSSRLARLRKAHLQRCVEEILGARHSPGRGEAAQLLVGLKRSSFWKRTLSP